MGWFRSSRPRPAQDSLELANVNLKLACGTQDPKQALNYCKVAKKELENIKLPASLEYHDQIIAAYREHGEVLKKLGFTSEATISYNKAIKIENNSSSVSFPTKAHVIARPLLPPPTKSTLIHGSTPVPLVVSAAIQLSASLQSTDIPVCVDPPVAPEVSSSSGQSVLLYSSSHTIPDHNVELVPASIFAKDFHLRRFKGTLPKPDEVLTDTRQLTYCLALLQASPSLDDLLDEPTRMWLHTTKTNQDEQERLKTMAADLLLEFMRDGLKDEKTTAEIAYIAPVLESSNFRSLLGILVASLKDSPLLHIHTLEGLDRVIKCAAPGSIDPDDLIKILEYVNLCLQGTYTQSSDHVYRLTRTASHILDTMIDGEIKDLDRVKLHTPLLLYTKELEKSTDPYMVFQAAYAVQALLRIPDDEQPWQTVLRHTGTALKGTARLFSTAKAFNVGEFIDTVQGGLQVAVQILGRAGDAYKDFSALKKSGQDLLEALKSSFNSKRDWYPMLRGLDALLQNGELIKFKTMICDAPCRRELAFQWGICLRLGNLAADPVWDIDSQQGAVAFLGEIYRNDAVWGEEAKVKQCILDILMQLASTSGSAKQAADCLLQEFENDKDVRKRVLYDCSRKEGPSSHLWKIALPPLSSSPLLDCIQKTPAVEADLRRLGCIRLQELNDIIYVSHEAKAHRGAADHDRFYLTKKTEEFLGSNKKVLLIWGDSGAGKSTFNKALERWMWYSYNNCKDRILRKKMKIPIFVSLPAIDKSESDIIGRQLREADFSIAQIKELKASREFVLICDGYDEYQQKRNLYNINKLNRPGQWNAQMVISCRSEYLGHDYIDLFRPEDRQGQMGETLIQEAVIAPFSILQIEAYIEMYVAKEKTMQLETKDVLQWEIEDYLRVFEQIPTLKELITNPFLLTLSLRVLSDMANRGKNLPWTKVTKVILYDSFVEQWAQQGKERLIKRELAEDDKKAFDTLMDGVFSKKAVLFMKRLAVAIFENQDGTPIVEYLHDRDKDTWKAEFFGQDDGKQLLREACPLRRDRNLYQFIHQSVLEYGLARAIFEPRQREEDWDRGMETTTAATERSEHQGVEKAMSMDANSPLFRKSYVNKPAILHFLAERVQQEPFFKQQLLNFVEYSKTDKKWCIAAANAMTILIRAGERFNGKDLKGIQIPGADLNGGQFDFTQLQGADLRNANLSNVWLRQANLNNARISGVHFGGLPFLKGESKVRSCAYSPDGRTFAVGLDNGTMNVYDTRIWVKIHTWRDYHKISALPQKGNCMDFSVIRGFDYDDYTSLVYSPSRNQFAFGNDDNTMWLCDAETGSLRHILGGHTGTVISVAFSPSGHQIVSGSFDETVRLWDVQTGSPGLILSGHTKPVTSVVYSPSCHQIASGSRDMTVRLWDAQTGAPGPILTGHTMDVSSVVYSPSGHQIATGSLDWTVRLWDACTGAVDRILSGHTDRIRSVVYSPSGHQIASASIDDVVRLWDVQTGSDGPILSGHTECITNVTYLPSGDQITTGSEDDTVWLCDVQSVSSSPTIGGFSSDVIYLTYLRSSASINKGWGRYPQLLAAQDWDPEDWDPEDLYPQLWAAQGWHPRLLDPKGWFPHLWNAQADELGTTLIDHTDYLTRITYSPNGQQIATTGVSGGKVQLWDAETGAGGTVQLWDAQTGELGVILIGHTSVIWCVAYSPSGHQIASGGCDETVRLWDTQTGAPGHILRHSHKIRSVIYSPNGRQIASAGLSNTLQLWDAHTGEPGLSLCGHTCWIISMTYSPSGHQIATRYDDGTLRLWDSLTGSPGPIFTGHSGKVIEFTYSPSGHQIATIYDDGTMRLWDSRTGSLSPILTDYPGKVTALTYPPSGQQIASGGNDGTVRLWDAETGSPGHILSGGHTSAVYRVEYSPSGHQIASVCCDQTVCLWDVDLGQRLGCVSDFYGVIRGIAWDAKLKGIHVATYSGHTIYTWRIIERDTHGLSGVYVQLLTQRGAVGTQFCIEFPGRKLEAVKNGIYGIHKRTEQVEEVAIVIV